MGKGRIAVAVVAGAVVAGGLVVGFTRGHAPSAYTSIAVAVGPVNRLASAPPIPPRIPAPTAAPMPTRVATPAESGCRIGRGPAGLPEVPAAVTARVDTAWGRIERWLAARAPATKLGRPVAPARIAAGQREMGAPFPADLVASLERHDGVETPDGFQFPPFYQLGSLDGLVDEARTLCAVLAEPGLGGGAGSWWSGQWVPVAVDHSGDSLFLGPAGRVGEHDNEGGAGYDGLPADFAGLLETTADTLETGRPADGKYPPVVRNGLLRWEIPH